MEKSEMRRTLIGTVARIRYEQDRITTLEEMDHMMKGINIGCINMEEVASVIHEAYHYHKNKDRSSPNYFVERENYRKATAIMDSFVYKDGSFVLDNHGKIIPEQK